MNCVCLNPFCNWHGDNTQAESLKKQADSLFTKMLTQPVGECPKCSQPVYHEFGRPPRVFIQIKGGVPYYIHADDPNTRVTIIDLDTQDEEVAKKNRQLTMIAEELWELRFE